MVIRRKAYQLPVMAASAHLQRKSNARETASRGYRGLGLRPRLAKISANSLVDSAVLPRAT